MKRIIAVLTFLLLLPLAQAREVMNQMSPGSHTLYDNVALDSTLINIVGYAYGFHWSLLNRDVTITGDLTVPVFLVDGDNLSLSFASRIPIVKHNNWTIVNRLGMQGKRGDSTLFRTHGISLEEGLLLGYFSNQWFLTSEFNYEKYLLTYVQPTDRYKSTIYADVVSGWYGDTGEKISIGMQGGYSFSNGIGINMRVGMPAAQGFGGFLIPYYANLGISILL